MARHSTPTPSRRSPRKSVSHQSFSPRRSPRNTPRRSTLHHFVAPRHIEYELEVEVEFHVYSYHPPSRIVDFTRSRSGELYYRTIPQRFNPFAGDGLWSFSPRSGVTRTSTLGRKVGNIHFSILPGTVDATFYVCVSSSSGHLRWVEVERGFRHPLHPTHVLYQRGRSAPRWILTASFARYVRKHRGDLSVFN